MFDRVQKKSINKDNDINDGIQDQICVDLHCHSSFSDGALTPEKIAKKLSDSGVKYAALTDHNTLAGTSSFQWSLKKHNIGYISGLEITTEHKKKIIHLLAYGFNPEYHELIDMLSEKINNIDAINSGAIQTFRNASEIIELIHVSGGLVFLAHPFQTEPDIQKIRGRIDELKKLGLDGIEAFYGPNSSKQEEKLLEIATDYDLLVSAGTDYHLPKGFDPGITIKREYWNSFRDALINASFKFIEDTTSQPLKLPKKQKTQWFSFFINIFLPAILTLTLFIVALFVFLLPYFEDTLMERKRENIRQLTQVAWGVLNEAAEEVENNQLSLEQAQTLAKDRIEAMRYGVENKDYFWLQDTSPRILMHPYRKDLINQDVTDYQDAQGTRIFVAFSELVLEKGEGYISYVWQWKDDPDRQEPKESYIRLFEPWGWVIGTGIYVNDVQAEIDILRNNIVKISISIIAIVLLLLLYLIRQSILLEKSRIEAEKLLLESIERYQSLSEAASEGALFVYDGHCRYANTVMYEFIGCTADKIELLDLQDIFPDTKANTKWLDYLSKGHKNETPSIISGVLRRSDGTLLSCNMTVKIGLNDPKFGFMILIKRSDEIVENASSHIALSRLLDIPDSVSSDLTDSIKNAYHINEVVNLRKRTYDLVVPLLENGTSSIAIAYMISQITDLVTQKIIELSIKEIGNPPAPFTFLALGSHGRQSQTLFSDQDNAIIYKPTGEENKKDIEKYFLKLGTMVCDALELAGYKKCSGEKMASNPEWCKPLSIWKSYFEDWIRNSDPQKVVEFSILFDFRTVAGDPDLATELYDFISFEIQETPFFLSQVAQNTLIFKTPLRLFGNILKLGGKDHSGMIDVKTPATAIVCFARLYAMKNEIRESNTLRQLDAIKSLGIILDSKHRDIVAAYETLTQMRLWNQAEAYEHNQQMDNWIDPGKLSHLEEVFLIECFKEIDELQKLIQREFLA